MPYNLIITNEAFEPISGAVMFYDRSGVLIGRQPVPAGGVDLDTALVEASYFVDIVSEGYTTYSTGVALPEGGSTVTLVREDPLFLYIAVGALAGLVLTKLLLPKFFSRWIS